MRSHALGAAALGLLLFLAPTAQAGFYSWSAFDNPDLVDVNASGSASKLRKNFVSDDLDNLYVGNSTGLYYIGYAYGTGTVYASGDGNTVDLVWFIYEPDKVQRSSTSASISQATWLGISMDGSLVGSPVGVEELIHDCSGSASFTTKDGGTCQWKVSCGGRAFTRNPFGPEMSDSQQAALNRLIGGGFSSKTTKGGCFNSLPPPP